MGISDEDWEIVEYSSDQSEIEENNLYFGFSDLALGSEEGLCLSKTLKSREVNTINPELYLDANEASILIDNPLIVNSPPLSYSMKFEVVDKDNKRYNMKLSHKIIGDIGFSITADWERFVRVHNLKAGDEVSFYRNLKDTSVVSDDYHYILKYVRKSSDCGNDAQTSDVGRRELKDKQRETEKAELKDDKIALENTTIASIGEHKVEHDQIQRYGPVLSSRNFIHIVFLNVDFSMNLLVFDEYDRVYNMLLSECSFGKMAYSITAEWDTFVRVHKLKAGDDIFFHRINLEALNASDDYCYILKYVRKFSDSEDDTRDTKEVSPCENTADKNKENMSGPGSRPLPREACCLSKTLTRISILENGRLYFDAYDAMTLTDSPGIVEYPPGTYSKDLLVFDEDDRRYTMNLSNHISEGETRFCLNMDWNTFCKTHDLKQGDRLMIYRVLDASVSEEAYYVLKYSRKNTL
ncbi:hypothetical protein OROHE_007299 [Orobanche hederae]